MTWLKLYEPEYWDFLNLLQAQKHLCMLLSLFVGQEKLQSNSCCSFKTCLVVLLWTRSLICIGTMHSSAGYTACKISQRSKFWKYSKTSVVPCLLSKFMSNLSHLPTSPTKLQVSLLVEISVDHHNLFSCICLQISWKQAKGKKNEWETQFSLVCWGSSWWVAMKQAVQELNLSWRAEASQHRCSRRGLKEGGLA